MWQHLLSVTHLYSHEIASGHAVQPLAELLLQAQGQRPICTAPQKAVWMPSPVIAVFYEDHCV